MILYVELFRGLAVVIIQGYTLLSLNPQRNAPNIFEWTL